MKLSPPIAASLLLASLLVAGCHGKVGELERDGSRIDVFGIRPGSQVDYREINQLAASEEPCLKGYERSFDGLDIIIGYGFDHKIRKISTRNPGTSMFGIKPGMSVTEASELIGKAGFRMHKPPFTYLSDGYTLTLLVEGDRVFGLVLESQD
jgi:hypothetical protein